LALNGAKQTGHENLFKSIKTFYMLRQPLIKVIITYAVTGATHTYISPRLPITPKQIADEVVKAAEAGAAIVHIHARDPKTGKPTCNLSVFREILTRVRGAKQRSCLRDHWWRIGHARRRRRYHRETSSHEGNG